MDKKTIGSFISVLRKSKGITQQELADMLNISNKAISRWETDQCLPDLTLIPPLAEILNVTCDELLKGERILNKTIQQKSEIKIDKQIKSIINRSLTIFKNSIYISLSLAVMGLIIMLGVSYGFYRPVIGFAVMMLFEAAALLLTLVAINKLKEVKADNELFESIEKNISDKFSFTLGKLSFVSIFLIASIIIISSPLIIFKTEYGNSVLRFGDYFSYYLIPISAILIFLYFNLRVKAINKISEKNLNKERNININKLQLILIALCTISYLISPFFDSNILRIFATIALIYCVVLSLKEIKGTTEKNKKLKLIRNIFISISSLFSIAILSPDFSSNAKYYNVTLNLPILIIICAVVSVVFITFKVLEKKSIVR